MMTKQSEPQPALFYHGFNLERRVRKDHPLRRVEEMIDFDFTYGEVEHLYGAVGHESVPPPVVLKLMFLLAFYNVRSERELLETLPERLDWLWFLRYDIDTPIPNHSILSKARRRWGAALFRKFFERVVKQCMAAGLVDGRTTFCDSSLIDADASVDSIVKAICVRLTDLGDDAEVATDADGENDRGASDGVGVGEPKAYSTTDPEAAVVSKRGGGRSRPRYKTHRAVEGTHGVITATILTPGDENEGHRLMDLIDQHESVTGVTVRTAVADSQYGTTENLIACKDRNIEPHMSVQRKVRNRAAERGLFTQEVFEYCHATDTYTCPAGKTLRRAGKPDRWGLIPYNASQRDCRVCPLRPQCTTSAKRTVRRHVRQDEVDAVTKVALSRRARTALRKRKWLIEGSFGQSERYGLKRARWRGLERVTIQDLLIAIVQNVMVLCRYGAGPRVIAQAQTATAATNRLQHALAIVLNRAGQLIVCMTQNIASVPNLIFARSPSHFLPA